MKKPLSITLALLLLLALFAGCGTQSTSITPETDSGAVSGGQLADTTDSDERFTDRDKEIGYSEAESTLITLSDNATEISGEGASVRQNTVTISNEGTYILRGSLTDGQLIIDAADDAKLQLVLDGVELANSSGAALYIKNADKVFLTTAAETENRLAATGEDVTIDENNIDGTIFAKSDLTLNGAGALTVSSAYGHGVVSKDTLVVTSGSYEITAAKHGLSGKDSVCIAGGTFVLDAGTDAIHSENDEDTALGFVYIAGGDFTVTAGDDGIHAAAALTVTGGRIDIRKSYEGLEGLSIDISGGEISVVSSDDGLNAASGSDNGSGGGWGGGMSAVEGCYILISGGSMTIDSGGDGIDSNGEFTLVGGTTVVYGPTNSGNGAIDYNGTALVTGGTLLAAGSSGMAEGFGDESTQGSILYGLNSAQSGGTRVTLRDSGGSVLADFVPTKQFQALNISVPGLTENGSYTLTVGTEEYNFTLDGLSYASGGSFGGIGGGPGQWGGGKGPEGDFAQNGELPNGFGAPPSGGVPRAQAEDFA